MFRLFPLKLTELTKCLSGFGRTVPGVDAVLTRTGEPVGQQVMAKRSVIYYTHSQGRMRSNKAVLRRFYRLNWGAWIRPRAGRHKHLWEKPYHLKWWTKQHVFCSDEHNKVLDQMVDQYYKIPTYFVDDPYEPYQKRHNFAFVPLGRNSISTSYINTLHEYRHDETQDK